MIAGAAVAGGRWSRRAPAWLAETESWLLWLGTAAAWLALGLGLLAEKTAPHVPPAWETLADHETLAWWTVAAFTALSCLRLYAVRTGRDGGKLRGAQALLWVLGLCLLIATAMHGGELVFRFGMGVGES